MFYEDDEGSRHELMRMLVDQGEAPAFVRRSRSADDALEQLHQRCSQEREEMLELPRALLAALEANLQGDWSQLRRYLVRSTDYEVFAKLYDDWKPRKVGGGMDWMSTTRRSLTTFVHSAKRFNSKWEQFVARTDIDTVNQVFADFNQYYPIEKACAIGIDDVSRLGFQPLEMVTHEQLLQVFPLVVIPELASTRISKLFGR